MQNDHAERIAELLAELRLAQAVLTERQRLLLRAVAADQPRQGRLCQDVRVLSERVMAIIDQVGEELGDQEWQGMARPAQERSAHP